MNNYGCVWGGNYKPELFFAKENVEKFGRALAEAMDLDIEDICNAVLMAAEEILGMNWGFRFKDECYERLIELHG